MHQDRVRHRFPSHRRVVSNKRGQLTSIASLLRYRVTEQPHKIPYYAALLKILHEPPPPEIAPGFPEGVSLGRSLLEDFWKGFQGYLDQLAWREIRLCVR
jgi:nuclear cap-binding protein subunit 1